jgi:hypothetical protein
MKNITCIFILLMSFVLVDNAMACSYMYQTPQETYDQNEHVFIGKVTKTSVEGGINGTRSITFQVLKTYKGSFSGTVTLTTGANSAMCGFEDGAFNVRDTWVIHTSDSDSFNSLPHNTSYEFFEDARAALDPLSESDAPTVCPLNYDPVCGQKDTGIRCVTVPCPSTENKTYGNTCQLNADKAEFLYAGECKVKPKEIVKPVVKDEEEVVKLTPTSSIPMDITEKQTIGFFSRILNFFKSIFSF